VEIIKYNFYCLDVRNQRPERERLGSDLDYQLGKATYLPHTSLWGAGTHIAFAIAGVREAPRTLCAVRPKKPFAAATFL
jgi:hypothetical protein